MVLRGKRMPGTEDGSGPLSQARPLGQRYGGDRRPAGTGQPDLAAAARPAGLPPEGRDMAAALEWGSSPAGSPAWSWRGARLSHASPLDDLASPAWSRAAGPALGVPKARP
jgi:hypothetical protein